MKDLSLNLFGDSEIIAVVLLCLAASLLVWLFFKFVPIHWKEEPKQSAKKNDSLPWLRRSRPKPVYTKKDWFAVTLLTVLYAIVSLWQLGSSVMPTTTWQPSGDSQFFILELPEDTHFDAVYAFYGEGDNNNNPDNYQLGFHQMQIMGGDDKENWTHITYLDGGSIYQWLITPGDWNFKYIAVVSNNKNDTLSEIAFKAYGEDRLLPVTVESDSGDLVEGNVYPASLVVDEQEKVCLHPTYYDEGYFDEIYHPRNAWEIANGQLMYASVHPLFGTTLIAIGTKLFGMSPLGWRLPGAIFGILLVPLFYAVAKLLFRKWEYAALGTLFFVVDFMHITTSRIGTLEPFSVFFIVWMFYFMIRYFYTSFYDTPYKKTLWLLAFSGITMSIGISVKWTACYSAVGLAILLFTNFGLRAYEYTKACALIKDKEKFARLSKEDKETCTNIKHVFSHHLWTTVAWCFLFFIGFLFVIYCASYIPTKVWRDGYSISNVFRQIQGMYSYHANLDATHPYSSTWYQWILDIRPIWYYNGTDVQGVGHTISCFSNPILCWAGFITTIFTIGHTILKKNEDGYIIVVGYLTALVPWVFMVQRCVFAYHFYPSSIFMLLSIVYFIRWLLEKHPKAKTAVKIFAVVAVIVFIVFLPVLTGWGTTYDYVHLLAWLPSWYFG